MNQSSMNYIFRHFLQNDTEDLYKWTSESS